MGLRLYVCLKNGWSAGHFQGCCTPGFQQPRINDTRALNMHTVLLPSLPEPQSAASCLQLMLGLRSRLVGTRAVASSGEDLGSRGFW